MIRAVIFDFNGVILNDEPVHYRLFREIFAAEGIELTEHDYQERYLGLDDRGCFESALRRAGQSVQPERLDELVALKSQRYEALDRSELPIFPGAFECIREMAGRWPLAVCSAALRPEIEDALERLDVREEFDAIITAGDTTRAKPDPEAYFLALDALRSVDGLDLEAGHCLVVEDSLLGVSAGKAAGMWVLGISHTYPDAALRSAGADAVIRHLTELTPRWVERFFRPEISP